MLPVCWVMVLEVVRSGEVWGGMGRGEVWRAEEGGGAGGKRLGY